MNVHDAEFARNLGFFSEQEQERLIDSSVAIAGAGGDGGMLAIQLARLGVGELRLADPDPFEAENINRQAACTTKTIGMNKAVAVGEYVNDINPDIKVVTYTDGVTPENVESFVAGSDLLIDETEFTMHALGVMLAREARKQEIPNLMAMNIGFGTTVTSYHPKGKSFEKMLGLSEDAPLDEIAEQEVPLSRWLAYVPTYADLDVFKKVAAGEKSAPSVAPGVAIAAGTAAVQAVLHLTSGENNRRPKPVYAPKTMMVDVMTGESKVIKHPLASHYRYLGGMLARNLLKLNPKASY
jgi:molybdopterin/thiamine biosynthesis adenylyltransferase